MKFKRFLEVGQGLLFGRALAGDIDLEALRYKPVALSPHGCRERSLHEPILPYIASTGILYVVQLHEPRMYGALLEVNCRRLENIGTEFLPIFRLSEDGVAQRA
jgi:hypothetical protein